MRNEASMPPQPPEWVRDSVFYQIFPDRFARGSHSPPVSGLERWESPPTRHGFKGGDLDGLVERLDWLVSLGVDALYLNPIFSSASNHRYHTFDYFEVDPLLGGDRAFEALVEAAHARGIKLVLDGVFNHASRGFWPFHHVLENGRASPYADWFQIQAWPLHPYDESRPANYTAWFGLRALPKINVRHPPAREYLLSAAEHWTRRGIDGWRLDVPTEIEDPEFWPEFRRRVRAINPEAYLVGEIWREAPDWLSGDRFDALMNYPFARAALGFAAKELRGDLLYGDSHLAPCSGKDALARLHQLTSRYDRRVVEAQLNLLGSHDTPRCLTLARGDHRAFELATLLQMTVPGAPCVYYGDEIGMEGEADPDCRRAFPWDRARWHQPTLEVVRRAIRLRRDQPLLRRGRFVPLEAGARFLAFAREQEEAGTLPVLVVAVNAAVEPVRLSVRLPHSGAREGRELWAAAAEAVRLRSAGSAGVEVALALAPRSARVVEVTGPPE